MQRKGKSAVSTGIYVVSTLFSEGKGRSQSRNLRKEREGASLLGTAGKEKTKVYKVQRKSMAARPPGEKK